MRPELCDLLGPCGFTAPEMTKKIWELGVFRDSRGSHTDFWLCLLSLFIYLLSGSKLRWGVDCNMQVRCPYQAACELGLDILQRQRTYKMRVSTNSSIRIMLRHWQSAHHLPGPCRPSLSSLLLSPTPHLLSTFVWFTVIRSKSRCLLQLLMHCGFHITLALPVLHLCC